MKKLPFLTIAAAVFAIAGSFTQVKTTQAAVNPDCTLTPETLAGLQTIQNDPTLTPQQEISQEAAMRRQLISATITCAVQDAQALKTTLQAASSTGTNQNVIQSHLSGKIDDAINFYNIELAKLNDAGISATKAIAKEMIAWRAVNYASLPGDVNNFALWSENQTLFDKAQTRLTQTEHVVAFIENAAGNNNLAIGLTAARSSFNTAQDENTAAGTAIAQGQPADQTLALIQQSLQSLADTYQKFSDLNTLIQTLLPTSQ